MRTKSKQGEREIQSIVREMDSGCDCMEESDVSVTAEPDARPRISNRENSAPRCVDHDLAMISVSRLPWSGSNQESDTYLAYPKRVEL
jgi:hypothetical protein